MKFVVLFLVFAVAVLLTDARHMRAASDDPKPTDVQQLKLENLALKKQITDLRAEVSNWQAAFGECAGVRGKLEAQANSAAFTQELTTWKADFEKSAPGYTWDFATAKPVPVPPASNASPKAPTPKK